MTNVLVIQLLLMSYKLYFIVSSNISFPDSLTRNSKLLGEHDEDTDEQGDAQSSEDECEAIDGPCIATLYTQFKKSPNPPKKKKPPKKLLNCGWIKIQKC